MKKENKINVKMFRIVGDYAPIVTVSYMDKDAIEHSALMIIDSCSTDNILTAEMANYIGVLCRKDKTVDIVTSSNTIITSDCVDFSFAFGGVQFHEYFYIGDHHLPHIAGELPLVGIIGNKFMLKHGLVIDYSDFTIHTSNVSPDNLTISDCDFFIPMGIGLEYYGLPVLPMIQGGNQIITLADSGASFNIIAKKTLDDNGFDCQYLKRTDSIAGIAGTETEAEDANVNFKLLTLVEGEASMNEISHRSLFKVIPHYIYNLPQGSCDKDGEPLPPVEAVICSPFMAKEGWILDFGAEIIYRRKSA